MSASPARLERALSLPVGTPETQCFHCGLPVPDGTDLYVEIDGQEQPMCCPGCQAVAQAIVESGLVAYYRFRTKNATVVKEPVPDFLRQTLVYDNPQVQKTFVRRRRSADEVREASLIIEGIVCAACVWLNERHLQSLPGVLDAQINYSTHRAQVTWDDSRIRLSDILQAIYHIGYVAHPYDPTRQEQLLEQERKQQLRRIGVAGVLGMQVMMIAIALYAGAWSGMEAGFRSLFHWVSLVLTIPVVLYSARPFFAGAWRNLKASHVGMDVPVALGISMAFVGSGWATFTGHGHVYYDSVVMFVFLLLVARYFEFLARRHSAHVAETLVHPVPATATRLVRTNAGLREEAVSVAELQPGDRVLVRPGESIPADGRVLEGRSSVDESLLSGESRPVVKAAGVDLVGGALNIESPLEMAVEKTGQDTVLSHILQLVERAQAEKPKIAHLADRIAGWLVTGVLILAAITAMYWWSVDPSNWLPITVSVLVVTCPCALSLATPTALTAATATLTRLGLLTTRAHALETLARASHFVFDKTGTMTYGRFSLLEIKTCSQMSVEECLRVAAGLERHSEHPIARALAEAGRTDDTLVVSSVTNVPGAGLQGSVAGKAYFIGTPEFIRERTGLGMEQVGADDLQSDDRTIVILADEGEIHAAFFLGDEVRTGAREVVMALTRHGKAVSLLSGDRERAVRRVAAAVGIEDVAFQLRPRDKLERIKEMQAAGAVVAMVGDGVNDAPVLSGAQVSVAMGEGTQVARASADLILLTDDLPRLVAGMRIARKTLRIIHQNLLWGLGYNLIALPAAASGYVPPWIAAIGMSASSLVVVANAMRLSRQGGAPRAKV